VRPEYGSWYNGREISTRRENILVESYPFHDRVYAVTGASRGIGLAVVKQLRAKGAYVGAIARGDAGLRDLESANERQRILAVQADVGSASAIGPAIEAIATWRGRLDGVIANAAVSERGEFATISVERIEQLVRTNVQGALLAVRHALPHLRDGARIVLIGSFAGRRGTPGLAAYSATKGALLAFSSALRAELAPRGISVSWVAPAATRTAMRGEDSAGVTTDESAQLVLRALSRGEPYVEATPGWRIKAWFETVAPRAYDRWIRFKLRRTP
jgi:NAD(P)-dependent dehydrogenase (short-subunit alcohol dehydrogenase family)